MVKHDEVIERLSRLEVKVDECLAFIKTADECYASKITEKVVYALIGVIITVVVTALIGTVVKAWSVG